MTAVTLYTKPGCMPCRAIKKRFDAACVDYTIRDVTEDPDAAAAVRAMGYNGVPVTHVRLDDGEDHWHGVSPMNMAAVIELFSRCP